MCEDKWEDMRKDILENNRKYFWEYLREFNLKDIQEEAQNNPRCLSSEELAERESLWEAFCSEAIEWVEKRHKSDDVKEIDKFCDLAAYIYNNLMVNALCIDLKYTGMDDECNGAGNILGMEIFFGGDISPDEKIDSETFVEDYEKYWSTLKNIEFDSAEGWTAEFLNLIQAEDKPMVGTEIKGNRAKRYLLGRAERFYRRFVKEETLDRKAEFLYFNMFAVFLVPMNNLEHGMLEKVKSIMTDYKKENIHRTDIIAVLYWSAYITNQLIGKIECKLTYQEILSFLNNFNAKRRVLQIFWLDYFNECMEADDAIIYGMSPRLAFDFEMRANKYVTRLWGDWNKNGTLSVDVSSFVGIIRNFFQKGDYDKKLCGEQVAYKDMFMYKMSENNPSESEQLDRDMLTSYRRLWVVVFEMLGEHRKNSFLSIVEHIRVMAALDDFISDDSCLEEYNDDLNLFLAAIEKDIMRSGIGISLFGERYVGCVMSICREYCNLTDDEMVKIFFDMFENTAQIIFESWDYE